MDAGEGTAPFNVELDESYGPLPAVYLALLFVWLLSGFCWTINSFHNRHFQTKNLQWMLASVPLIKALHLMLSFLFWYSCFYLEICSLWLSFGVYITGVLFQTSAFLSFLLISHGYCILSERLSINESRAMAALSCVFYLTLVGYRASVPYFTVLLLLNYLVSFYLIFYQISQNLSLLKEQLTFIMHDDVRDMHDAVYTKYIMFKKFQAAMQVVAMSVTAIHINVDTSSDYYWLRLLLKEWAQFCILLYIGWTFRSQDLGARFYVIPTVREGETVVPPIYSIEMDSLTFKDFHRQEWRIGVPVSSSSSSSENTSLDSVVVVIQQPHSLRLPNTTAHSPHQ